MAAAVTTAAPAGLPAQVATGRTLVMGVVNVTPDSFSDGGHYLASDAAVEHGLALVAEGADLVDEAEELRRVLPVVRELAAAGVAVSIDTMRARVAGLEGLRGDPRPHGVDADRDTGAGQLTHDRQDPPQLLGLVDPLGARSGRLAADVDQVGPLGHQGEPVLDRRVAGEVVAAVGVAVSIDTMRARVAAQALEAGAALVNDVSGGLADDDMARVVAGSTTPYVVMHWRGHSAGMAALAHYDDVVADVTSELRARLDALAAAGVDLDRVVLDPGLGFAKDAGHNWALLANLAGLAGLGRPLLVGASRKGFLGALLADADGAPRPVEDRDVATAVVSAAVADLDAVWAVRVHAVRPTVDALAVVRALRSARVER